MKRDIDTANLHRALRGWIGLGLLAWLFAGCASPAQKPTSKLIPRFLSSSRLEGFGLSEHFERRGAEHWTLTNAGTVLKVEGHHDLDRDSAILLLEDGRMGIEALYANALSPYPGDISFKIETQKEFLPRSLESRSAGVHRSGFLLFANDRQGYGATTKQQTCYKSVVGWIHCEKTGSLYKVRWFVPQETPDQALRDFFNSLKCG